MLFSADYELRRGQLPPAELIRRMQTSLEAVTHMGGPGLIQYPGGFQTISPDVDNLWIVIEGQGELPGSGSSGGAGGSASGSGVTVIDNRYAWRQARLVVDADGKERWEADLAGLSGTETINPAVELNNRSDIEEGTIVRAWRSPTWRCWHFVWGGELASGSGSAPICIDCDGDGKEETCFEEWKPGHLRPRKPPTPPHQMTPKECYDACLAAGGTKLGCSAACNYTIPPDPNPPVPPTGGGGGGGGGVGGGGFGGGGFGP